MGKNVIVSEETLRDLLEAHASLSAWYHELWTALRRAGGTVTAPSDDSRAAFLSRLATEIPEIASIARSIGVPRVYVPPPPIVASTPPPPPVNEPPTAVEPATARAKAGRAGAEEGASPPTLPMVASPENVEPPTGPSDRSDPS